MPKMLTAAQVERYNRDGFLGPIELYGAADIAKVRCHVEDVEARIGGEIQSRFKIKAHLPFRWMWEVITNARLLDAVEDIIGPNILCWGSSFFQKEAHDPRFVSWHQDSTYYGLEPPETLTAWLAITDSTLESGCVRFVPGTHNKGIYAHEEHRAAENLLSRGQTIAGIDPAKAVPMVLKAGQFSFHKEDCVHGSDPNNSGNRRVGLSIHYIAPHVRETNNPNATAMVVRGRDTHGYWGIDPVPKVDWDPVCLEALDKGWKHYQAQSATVTAAE